MALRGSGWLRPHSNCQRSKKEPMILGIIGSICERTKVVKEIPVGARGEAQQSVTFEHTLTAHHPELPPVYSTPDMIRLMEIAAFHALQPYCEGDEITVGTSINIQHRAASGIGAHIKAQAVLQNFDGRFYTLAVTARDDAQEIGCGTVGRAVVSVNKFLQRMKSRSRSAHP